MEDDLIIGRDSDGTLNEKYCKWCYDDGVYTYNNMNELIDVCAKNMANENFTEEKACSYFRRNLSQIAPHILQKAFFKHALEKYSVM